MAYDNIVALAEGRVSGRLSEWPSLKPEAKMLLDELATLRAKLAEAERERDRLAQQLSDTEKRLNATQCECINHRTELAMAKKRCNQFEDHWENCRIPCEKCGASGFSGDGSYGSVCDCAGGYVGIITYDDVKELEQELATAKDAAEREKHADQVHISSLAKQLAAAQKERDELQETLSAVEHEVAIVYDHITGGRISKCNTDARTVIAVADDYATPKES